MKKLIKVILLITIGFYTNLSAEILFPKTHTFLDTKNVLLWQDNKYTKDEISSHNIKGLFDNGSLDSNKAGSWLYAKKYCENLSLNSQSNWRLPTSKELSSLYKNSDRMKDDRNLRYWTSTDKNDNFAVAIFSRYGVSGFSSKKRINLIRCVADLDEVVQVKQAVKKSEKVQNKKPVKVTQQKSKIQEKEVANHTINNDLKFMLWYDSNPPTKNDKKFFNGAKKALVELKKNNTELDRRCKNKGIEAFTISSARKLYYKYERELKIPKDFFYDIEKAQNISAIKMITNKCRLTKGCSDGQIKGVLKNKLLKHSYNLASKNRKMARKREIDNRNSALLFAIGGAVVVEMVSSVMDSSHTPSNDKKYCSSNEECYNIVKSKGNETKIICKGYSEGAEYSIYYDSSKGKYFTQGAFVNNYEKSFKKLANFACGVY